MKYLKIEMLRNNNQNDYALSYIKIMDVMNEVNTYGTGVKQEAFLTVMP